LRRRDFIACIGAALAWPVRARAQQADRARRIGVLLPYADNDPEAKSHLSALAQELKRLGWSQDHNLRIDARFAAGIADQYPLLAKELAALQPDVMLSESTPAAAALKQETRSIPIVFVGVSDPVGSGLVTSLARPGGDLTGMMQYDRRLLSRSKQRSGPEADQVRIGTRLVAAIRAPPHSSTGMDAELGRTNAVAYWRWVTRGHALCRVPDYADICFYRAGRGGLRLD
jgi:ABC transporter substrate binding protein